MRFPGLALLFFASGTAVFAAPQTTPAPQANQQSANANGVDSIIALVQANMSEGLVLKTIQRQNKAYDLTPDDLLKLQKAGVSERIISAMLDPSTASASAPSAAPAGPPAAAAPPVTAAPAAAPAAPRTAAGPGAANPGASNLAASGAAGPGAASKGAPGSANSAAGCPQTSSTASTAAAAPTQPAPKAGVFSSFKDRMKGSAQKTVDGFGDTMNCAVDKGVQTSESRVSSTANSAAAAPGQAVSDATKPVTTATTNATNSATAAQTSAKKSATK